MSSTDDVIVRLRLADVQKFIADVRRGTLSIDDLERKIKRAGSTAKRESSDSGGLGMMSGVLGRLKYAAAGGLLGLGALATGAATFAVKTTANFEQVKMAFTTMLGSQSEATKQLAILQKFAGVTPFEFTHLAQTSQQMLAFGFSMKSVIPTLTAVGDAMSGLHRGQAGIDTVMLDLGVMKSKGVLQGEQMRDLAQNGVNASEYLMAALHLNKKQLSDAISKGKVNADMAINVILAGMERKYRGLMAKQSGTLGGIWSNLQDALSRAAIDVTSPFLPAMKHWLKDLVDHMPEYEAWFTKFLNRIISGGEKAGALAKVGLDLAKHVAAQLGAGQYHTVGQQAGAKVQGGLAALLGSSGGKTDYFNVGETVGRNAVGFILGFVNGLLDPTAWGPVLQKHWLKILLLVFSLFPVGKVLGVFGRILAKIPVLRALATVFERSGSVLEKAGGPVWKFVRGLGLGIWHSFERVFPEVAERMSGTLGRLTRIFKGTPRAVGNWGKNLMLTIVRAFLDAGMWAARDIAVGVRDLILFPFRKLGNVLRPIVKKIWSVFPEEFKLAINGIIDKWNRLSFTLPGGHKVGMPQIPYLAAGGTVTAAGTAVVGDDGPEVVSLPRGATVTPLPRIQQMAARDPQVIHTHVYLDRRQIALAVQAGSDDALARL